MKAKKKKQENYLEFIPEKEELQKYHINDEGNIVLHVERKSLYDKFARILRKHTPKQSYYTMDAVGTFVWNAIDGEKNLLEIGPELKKEFGESVEPLYERLAQFVQILEMNGFIKLHKK